LLRLPAAALHGTFLQAYALLTKLAAKVGWDELLRARSDVFVMEEEYRKAKEAEETKRKSITLEAIKDVQSRRVSAMEDMKHKLDDHAAAETGETMEKLEQEHSQDQPLDKEETGDIPLEKLSVSPNQETVAPDINADDATVQDTTVAAADKVDVEDEETERLEENGSEHHEVPVAVKGEEENVNERTSEPVNEISEETDKASTNEEEELKENGIETEENDSTVPSGAQTPTNIHTGDDKSNSGSMRKNAKKNQKKNRKKNKGKKPVQSPNGILESEDTEDNARTVKSDAHDVDNAISVPEEPKKEEESRATIPVGGHLHVESEEFAEIDIGSGEPATVNVTESEEIEPKEEEHTFTSAETPAQVEPSADPSFESVDESEQIVPMDISTLEPAMDLNADGTIEPTQVDSVEKKVHHVPQEGTTMPESTDATNQVSKHCKRVSGKTCNVELFILPESNWAR
jgi:hypothetical protein